MPQVATDVEIIKPPHDIANKVSKTGPNVVTESLLERTEKNIVSVFGGQYMEWVREDLKQLETYLSEFPSNAARDCEAVVAFSQCVHELRGMGGTFGYNLVSIIGDQMYRMIQSFDIIDDARAMALRLHLDALKVVVAQKITGDGGDHGRSVLDGLSRVYRKYT